MKTGDFTQLAKDYIHRSGYSEIVLDVLRNHIQAINGRIEQIADVGAGTGKLTENLKNLGLKGYAVEPNDAMRTEGIALLGLEDGFCWSKGTAEDTGLADNSVDWVLMGSSFHWTDTPAALKEFARILRPGGFFTAIWNPRNIESSTFHMEIENRIKEMIPGLKRVSSGSRTNMEHMEKKLLSTPYFKDLFLLEGNHETIMTKERYMGAWKSVNDIHVQAGDVLFEQILQMIEQKIAHLEEVVVPYTSRAFTVRSTKSSM